MVKKYKSDFKAKVALEALNEAKSLLQLSIEYKVPKTNIREWREKLLKESYSLFSDNLELNKKIKSMQNEIESLHKLIGELTIEHKYYKKKFSQLKRITN